MERIINTNDWGGTYTPDFIDNNLELVSDWVFTEVECPDYLVKKWNGVNWYEGATPQEILEASKPKIPEEISRMKFEIQLYITTTVRDENNNIVQLGKTFQDIIDYIDSLQMSNFYKNLLKMRLLSCVTLERDNDDLNALAPGMGISQAQLDEIFINGNTLQ